MSTISASTTSTTAYTVTADTTGALVLQTGSGPTTAVTVDTSQNVGIGTSSPGERLTVQTALTGTTAGSNVVGRFQSNGNGYDANISFGDNVNAATRIGYLSGNMYFWTNGAERVRIDTSGNVGIGTSSPSTYSAKLAVVSTAADTRISVIDDVANGRGGYLRSNYSDAVILGTTSGVRAIAFSPDNTERGRFANNGNFLVGTTTSPTQTGAIAANNELFVYNMPTTASGANCTISSGESNRFYRSTSALKYKQDIRDIELIDISKFRPVRYKSKCENDDQTKDHFGIIADEVHEAGITELVSYGIDGEIEGFQYDRLTVVLLKTIQEQQATIQTLTARIEALEAK